MAQPVWVLSVDLQTRTATFTSGLADAAKGARASFNDIKAGAQEMGRETGYSMMEARHGVMLLGEEFGVHLPRGVTSFLASLGPVGAAMEAAFPFLAIIVGATFLIEKLMKIGEEASKSGKEWASISEEVTKWGDNSKKELLDVQIQIDKLTGNKLKDLQDTLEKIDLSTLDHLKGEFDGLGKKAGEAFTEMRSGWLMTQLGMGNSVSDVQEMFASAMDKINADLANGDHKKLAGDLKAAADQMWNLAAPTYNLVQRLEEAHNELGANRIAADGHYQALLKAHGVLVSMTGELRDQEKIEKGRSELATDSITPIHNATDPRVAQERKAELASYMETAKQKAEVAEKLTEERMKLESGVTRWMAENYAKQVELATHAVEQEHAANVRANEEGVKDAESVRRISQLSLTSGASAYLISKQEEQAGIRAVLAKEQTDLQAAHQREIAEQQSFITKMSQLAEASSGKQKEGALSQSASAQEKLTAATRQYGEEMARITAAIQASDLETAKLNNSWGVFFARASQDTKSLAATMRGDLQSAMTQATNAFSQGIAKGLVEGHSFGKSMVGIARQMSESMIEGLIRWGVQDLITKMGMKATAAQLAGANATASMAGAPFPIDTSAPAFGASMLGAALAFEGGGIVPGVTRGDSVPAYLEPGEGVLTKRQMEAVSRGASSTDSASSHTHIQANFAPHIHALDADGVDRVLHKHAEVFHRHFESHVRRMNR